jgi:hypothetical protein
MTITYTNQELRDLVNLNNPEGVKQFIINQLENRKNELRNPYAPLYVKLTEVQNWVTNATLPKP